MKVDRSWWNGKVLQSGVLLACLLTSLSASTRQAEESAVDETQRNEQQAETPQSEYEDIETILSKPMAPGEYTPMDRCLTKQQFDIVRVLDEQTMVFIGRGDQIWLNRLTRRCVGLNDRDVLFLDARDRHACYQDQFATVDKFDLSTQKSTCILGMFQEISAEQLVAVKAALRR